MTALINKLRTAFLSPDSPLELRLRTVYHKVLSTRAYFLLQDFLAWRSYRKYRSVNRQAQLDGQRIPGHQPKVTFLLSAQSGAISELHATLASIRKLTGENWEVLILYSHHDPILSQYMQKDDRIRVVSPDITSLPDQINGEYVVFCEAGDLFRANLLSAFYDTLSEGSPVDLVYYDCEYLDNGSSQLHPLFKPATYAPALLLSVNYLSRSVMRVETLRKVWADIEPGSSLASAELQLQGCLCESGAFFQHVSDILLLQTRLVTPETADIRSALTGYLRKQGCNAASAEKLQTGVRFTWHTGSPSLAIIILTKNNFSFLQPMLTGLFQQPYPGELTIHIVDNNSDDPPTLAFYEQVASQPNLAIIPYPRPFNYSEAINLGAAQSHSDLLLFMNDDMALVDHTWLPELVQWAVRPKVGVVGAKLLRKNRTIQHAGIVMGLTGFAGHIYLNAPEHYHGLWGSVDWYRNMLALTGACQMVRREVFEEVGGYDQGYTLAFGDIDFCLKVHERGYRNVYTPFAQLYHYEGSTRGYKTPAHDALKGYEELEPYLAEEDPFFSPNLTYSRIPKCTLEKLTRDERIRQIKSRKRFFQKNK